MTLLAPLKMPGHEHSSLRELKQVYPHIDVLRKQFWQLSQAFGYLISHPVRAQLARKPFKLSVRLQEKLERIFRNMVRLASYSSQGEFVRADMKTVQRRYSSLNIRVAETCHFEVSRDSELIFLVNLLVVNESKDRNLLDRAVRHGETVVLKTQGLVVNGINLALIEDEAEKWTLEDVQQAVGGLKGRGLTARVEAARKIVAEKQATFKFFVDNLNIRELHHLANLRRAVFYGEKVVLSQLHHFSLDVDGVHIAEIGRISSHNLKEVVHVRFEEDDRYCSFQERLEEALRFYHEDPHNALKKHSEKKSTSDVFVLYHPTGAPVAIFKPRDGEVGMPYAGKYPERDVLKEEILRNVKVISLNSSPRVKDAEKRLQALFPDRTSRHYVVRRCQEMIQRHTIREATEKLEYDFLEQIPRRIMEEIHRGTHLVRVSTKEGSLAGEGYLKEIAAYLFCRTVGAPFVPVTVVREIPNLLDLYGGRERLKMLVGSFQEFIPEYHSLRDELQDWKDSHSEELAKGDYKTLPRLNGEMARHLVYVDLFMQNADRHNGNYDTRGNAVDHGLCFPDERGRHELDARLALSISQKESFISEEEKYALLAYPVQFAHFLLGNEVGLRFSCLQEFEMNARRLQTFLQDSLEKPLNIYDVFTGLYIQATPPSTPTQEHTVVDRKETLTLACKAEKTELHLPLIPAIKKRYKPTPPKKPADHNGKTWQRSYKTSMPSEGKTYVVADRTS